MGDAASLFNSVLNYAPPQRDSENVNQYQAQRDIDINSQYKQKQMEDQRNLINTQNLLKATGIAKERVIPLSSQELRQQLEQEAQKDGVKINFNEAKDATEQDKQKFYSGLFQAYKLPMPKARTEILYDMEAMRNLGGKVSSDGVATVSPQFVTQKQEEWKPKTKEEAIEFEKAKSEIKNLRDNLPPSIKRQKNLDTTALIQNTKRYENTNKRISETLKSLDEIPQGAVGSWDIKWKTLTGSKDPILSKWQDLKSLLSKIQLGQLQFTKGAISDREMEFFKTAVANDDIASYPRIKAVLERALQDNNTEIESSKAAYEKNYGEDPDEILGKSVTDAAGITKGKNKSTDLKSKYGLE